VKVVSRTGERALRGKEYRRRLIREDRRLFRIQARASSTADVQPQAAGRPVTVTCLNVPHVTKNPLLS